MLLKVVVFLYQFIKLFFSPAHKAKISLVMKYKVFTYDFITRPYYGCGSYDVERVQHFAGVINPISEKYSATIYSPLGASGVPMFGICHHGSSVKNIKPAAMPQNK